METEDEKRPKALLFAAIGSAIWLVAALLFVANSEACGVPTGNLFADHFSCRTINEVGDFLAGIFAPPAFMLLFAALHLQGHELREQRREFRLTRNEHEAARKAAEEQARVASATANFISKQTEIFEKQEDRRRRQEADEEFDEIVESIYELLASFEIDTEITLRGSSVTKVVGLFSPADSDMPPGEKLRYLVRHTRDTVAETRRDGYRIERIDEECWDYLYNLLEQLYEMSGTLTQPHQARMDQLVMEMVLDGINEMLKSK